MSQNKPRTTALLRQARKLSGENRLQEARELYLQVCNAEPHNRDAWVELSGLSRMLGNPQEAVQAAQHVLASHPDDSGALHMLGAALHRLQRLDEAIAHYRHALQLSPDNPETRYFLANALREQGRLDAAEAEYTRTIELAPDHVQALNNLSALLTTRGRIRQAAALLERALQASPDSPQMLVNLGRLKLHSGDAAAAATAFRKVLAMQPAQADVHSNLLACLNYLPDQAPGEVLAEHQAWNARHTAGIRPYSSWVCAPDVQRRLRIGYVSPDLCEHSVARFLEPVLAAHDHESFDVICYADVLHPDEVTTRLRRLSTHWRETRGLSHEQLAQLVHDDGVDILVDLAGHTANNRLPAFAMKPAPVQVTWLGYPNTTGLAAMDYRLTDARADPPGLTDDYHTETLVRLPDSFLCYRCPDDAPAVGPLPAGDDRQITFASFNNLAKTTPQVIHTWSRILLAVPGSRLVLKSRATGDADVRARLVKQFTTHGVGAEQVTFHDPVPSFTGHMDAYNQVDIALDTFPYNGTTTTCEALWMGVPVICLAGGVHAGRVGVSLLSQVGMIELVAQDEDAYVATAVRLAGERARLADIRMQLRATLCTSSLCDAGKFTRALEQTLRDLWAGWCQRQV